MKTVNQTILLLVVVSIALLFSTNAALAEDNPFSQQKTVTELNDKTLSQGMCGMGRCGRCGRCGGCGGGMMWRGKGMPEIGDISELPEPQSRGAKLVNKYCTQCHALPNPVLHSAEGWAPTIERMNARMHWMNKKGRNINAPDGDELKLLITYLSKHAKNSTK